MAVDSSALYNGVQPLDVAGAVNRGNQALQGQIQTEDMQQEHGDKQVIRDLSSVPGVDFSTPKGIKEFMTHLQGRVAPETIMKLGDMSTKMETAEAARVNALAKQTADKRQQFADQSDWLSGLLSDVVAEKDPIKQKDLMTSKVEKLRAEKLDETTPAWMPAALDHLLQTPQQQWESLYKGSSHAKELSQRANEEALAAERTSKANFWKEGGKIENWVSKEGKPLLKHQDGTFYSVDENGDPIKLAAMPEGAYLASKNKPDTANDPTKAKLTPETAAWLAEYTQRTRKPVPGLPAGTGAAATNTRVEYLNAFARIAREKGYTGEEAGEQAVIAAASQEALKSVITKNANVAAGEKLLEREASLIDEELKKLGGPDSPLVRKFWSSTSSEWLGDPRFAGLKAAYTGFKETAAKAFSNQTGAGGTPVTYLALADEALGKNPTLEQFAGTHAMLTKMFKAREDSNRETIMDLRKQGRLEAKPGSDADLRAHPSTEPQAVEAGTGIPAVMPGASPDAREELKRARQAAAAETDPKKRDMAVAAALALEKRIAGGDKPTIAEGTEKPSKSGKPMVFKGGKWVYKE